MSFPRFTPRYCLVPPASTHPSAVESRMPSLLGKHFVRQDAAASAQRPEDELDPLFEGSLKRNMRSWWFVTKSVSSVHPSRPRGVSARRCWTTRRTANTLASTSTSAPSLCTYPNANKLLRQHAQDAHINRLAHSPCLRTEMKVHRRRDMLPSIQMQRMHQIRHPLPLPVRRDEHRRQRARGAVSNLRCSVDDVVDLGVAMLPQGVLCRHSSGNGATIGVVLGLDGDKELAVALVVAASDVDTEQAGDRGGRCAQRCERDEGILVVRRYCCDWRKVLWDGWGTGSDRMQVFENRARDQWGPRELAKHRRRAVRRPRTYDQRATNQAGTASASRHLLDGHAPVVEDRKLLDAHAHVVHLPQLLGPFRQDLRAVHRLWVVAELVDVVDVEHLHAFARTDNIPPFFRDGAARQDVDVGSWVVAERSACDWTGDERVHGDVEHVAGAVRQRVGEWWMVARDVGWEDVVAHGRKLGRTVPGRHYSSYDLDAFGMRRYLLVIVNQ
uniref:Uncharacterized protein n=1 Tax=Mycena chlorophos TaxID=658473 RepID=A0ABQ0LFY3_MYCCL|nr:predicted protein [Mycena chlorophos]